MTGFGEARGSGPGFRTSVEVRSVNNRHLKVTVRGTDPYPLLESEVEKVVRRTVRRGTLLIRIHVERDAKATDLRLNTGVLNGYLQQLKTTCESFGEPELLASVCVGVLALPGVAPEPGLSSGPPDDEWPIIEKTLTDALAKLDVSRKDEGRSMSQELGQYQRFMTDQLHLIRQNLPAVMANYRVRLLERIRQAVADAGVAVDADHLIREVALFADRTDVAEEVSRLTAHLEQFGTLITVGGGPDGAGRRLEFVVQEMGREANTLGSKAGDVTISRHVVEIKATLEKIREMVQNVE